MLTKRTALIMELTPSRRSLLAELVQELGFPFVVAALSADNALERMDMIAFDVVFLEVASADQDGFAFVRKLRLDRKRAFKAPGPYGIGGDRDIHAWPAPANKAPRVWLTRMDIGL